MQLIPMSIIIEILIYSINDRYHHFYDGELGCMVLYSVHTAGALCKQVMQTKFLNKFRKNSQKLNAHLKDYSRPGAVAGSLLPIESSRERTDTFL